MCMYLYVYVVERLELALCKGGSGEKGERGVHIWTFKFKVGEGEWRDSRMLHRMTGEKPLTLPWTAWACLRAFRYELSDAGFGIGTYEVNPT
jgi:hypothetical protein